MSRSSELESIEHDIEETRHRIDRTLDSLAEKVSASRLVGDALDSVKENGGAFAGNLARTVRENPIPTTMLAAGLAWLMIADRNRRSDGYEADYDPYEDEAAARFQPDTGYEDDDLGPTLDPAATGLSTDEATLAAPGHPVAGPAEPSAGDRARAAAGRTSEAASSTLHRLGSGASKTAGAAREAGHGVKGRAAHVTERAKAAGGGAAGSARAAAHDVRDRAGRARQQASRRSADAYASARDATRRAGSFLTENPLMIGALGLAIGGIAAAALPSTRREDDWLGEAGDRARSEAAGQARRVAREGAQVAEAAAHSAKEEAKRRKLAPEDTRQATDEAAEQAVRGGAEVAKTAVRVAEEETRRRVGDDAESAPAPGHSGPGARTG